MAGNKESKKRERGAPTAYRKQFVEQAKKLCSLGATDSEIAEFFDVSVRTLYRWKAKHEDFCHALKIGKAPADDRVERSLYQKATGYYVVEQQAIKIKTGQYKEEIKVVDVEKYVQPDTTAMIYWTKNRKKEDWRDRVEHTGEDGAPLQSAINLAVLGDKELDALAGLLDKASTS